MILTKKLGKESHRKGQLQPSTVKESRNFEEAH